MSRNQPSLTDIYSGSWIPEIADATTGGNVGTYGSISNCKYIKIGNYVTVHGEIYDINTTGLTGTNNLYIRNLPCLEGGLDIIQDFNGPVRLSYVTPLTDSMGFSVRTTGTVLVVTELLASQNSPYVDVSQYISGSADIHFSCSYMVG
jgi:hypothetical protein